MDNQASGTDGYFRARFEGIIRELTDLAETATKLINTEVDASDAAGVVRNSGPRSRMAYLQEAKIAYELRRLRSKIFQNDALFGEPAWDMLLDLYIAELRGKPLSVTDACIGSGVPSTTALRWISILQDAGLINRELDTKDARRYFLHLTEQGSHLMQTYFDQAHSQIGS